MLQAQQPLLAPDRLAQGLLRLARPPQVDKPAPVVSRGVDRQRMLAAVQPAPTVIRGAKQPLDLLDLSLHMQGIPQRLHGAQPAGRPRLFRPDARLFIVFRGASSFAPSRPWRASSALRSNLSATGRWGLSCTARFNISLQAKVSMGR